MDLFFNSDSFRLIVVLLAIISIVLLFLKFGKDSKEPRIHLLYISGISVFLILELVTYICISNGSHDEIVAYVSFASTLSSLLLSVVAIIYAIVSNNKGARQYQKLDVASDKISISVEKFSRTSSLLSHKLDFMMSRIEEIKNISSEVKKAMENSDFLHGKTNTQALEGEQIDSNVFIKSYIEGGSYMGNLGLLCCVYSKEKNKSFPLETIDQGQYLYGYLIASSSLGIVQININNQGVLFAKSYLASIKPLLLKFIIDYQKENVDDEQSAQLVDLYTKVNDFFGIKG